ncbi:MAG: hypothetical protein DCO95_14540 [Roseivirga sp. XM-24bin3]|nr:MAG: hypothetical protein DCO95_14540 [Roseivirga sp. XM-24bin3]
MVIGQWSLGEIRELVDQGIGELVLGKRVLVDSLIDGSISIWKRILPLPQPFPRPREGEGMKFGSQN